MLLLLNTAFLLLTGPMWCTTCGVHIVIKVNLYHPFIFYLPNPNLNPNPNMRWTGVDSPTFQASVDWRHWISTTNIQWVPDIQVKESRWKSKDPDISPYLVFPCPLFVSAYLLLICNKTDDVMFTTNMKFRDARMLVGTEQWHGKKDMDCKLTTDRFGDASCDVWEAVTVSYSDSISLWVYEHWC